METEGNCLSNQYATALGNRLWKWYIYRLSSGVYNLSSGIYGLSNSYVATYGNGERLLGKPFMEMEKTARETIYGNGEGLFEQPLVW